MNENEAKKIMKREDLTRINWFDDGNLNENQVGIRKSGKCWNVYVTDERASIIEGSIIGYASEEEAYEALIQKARYGKKKFG